MSSKADQSEENPRWWKPSKDKDDAKSKSSESKDGGFDKRKALHNVSVALDVLKQVNEMHEFLKPLGMICDVLKFVVDTAENVLKNDDDRKALIETLRRQVGFIEEKTKPLVDARFPPTRSAVQGLVKALEVYTSKLGELQEVLEKMERKKEHGLKKLFHKVVSVDKDKEEISGCVDELEKAYRLFVDCVQFFIADQTQELLARQALNQLQYVDGAQGNQHAECLEGTRKLPLDEITQWASKGNTQPIFALIDQAGTGKSTISASMAKKWDEEHSLLCRFFFSKPKGITSGDNVASTFARDMAASVSSLRSIIVHALEENPNISGYAIDKKLELLVFAPLRMLREENNNGLSLVREKMVKKDGTELADLEKLHGNLQGKVAVEDLKRAYTEASNGGERGADEAKVDAAYMAYLKGLEMALASSPIIILDAFDECSKDDRTKILQAFLQSIATFPEGAAPFKLYFTCRPEEDVMKVIQGSSNIQRPTFSLQSSDVSTNQQDIQLYANSRLKDKLDAQEISQFVAKANGLFIWASTAATFILDARDPSSIFNGLMTSTLEEQPLSNLYSSIVDDACQKVGKNELRRLLEVLQLVCVAREPLTLGVMDELLGLTSKPGSSVSGAFVAGLGSVISDGSNGKPVQALHPTFIEYLLHEQSSPRFASLNKGAQLLIAQGSLAILLSKQVRQDPFDIVKPGLITPNNDKIEDLEQRIQLKMSPSLRYAAHYGILHSADCVEYVEVLKQIRLFFETKLLLWVELMSYLGKIPVITHSLYTLGDQLDRVNSGANEALVKEDREWCDEILRMIRPFQTAIMESAQQVYHSVLPFVPRDSKIYRRHYETFKAIVPRVLHGTWGLKDSSFELSLSATAISFSPNGHRIASVSDDYTVRLWDVKTGAEIGEPLSSHTDSVTCVSFSPDGRRIVSGSKDKTLRLWDVDSGAVIGDPLEGHEDEVTCLLFSPDGRRIISGSNDSNLRLWDGMTGVAIGEPLSGHTTGILHLALSADGRRIASGSDDGVIQLWDWDEDTGLTIGKQLTGHTEAITCLSFSPDSRFIASGSRDSTLRIYNADSGEQIGDSLNGHTGPVNCLSFSPDGLKIASGSDDGFLRLWNGETGEAIGNPIKTHSHSPDDPYPLNCLAFSPDGHSIATASNDFSVRLWDAESGAAIANPLFNHGSNVCCLAFSPKGHLVASGSSYGVQLSDVEAGVTVGNPLFDHRSGINALKFSPDGRRVASGSYDSTLRLRNGETGAAIGEPLSGHTAGIQCLEFSPDSRRIASGSDDHTVRLWDAETGAAVGTPLSGHSDMIQNIYFSPNGHRIASRSTDNTVRLWDAVSGAGIGEPLSGAEGEMITCVSFSPDSRKIALGLEDKTVRLWDAETGTAFGQPLSGHTEYTQCLVFSPDSSTIATGAEDKTIRLWNVEACSAIGEPLTGHTDAIYCVSFSPDGSIIASGTNYAAVRLWDARTGAPIGQQVEFDHTILSLEFRLEKTDLFLTVNGSHVLMASSSNGLQPASDGPIVYDEPWTIIHSKAHLRFRLPYQFISTLQSLYKGRVAHGGSDGSVIIIDCTHLL